MPNYKIKTRLHELYNPSLKLAWDIAKVFGVTIEEIFSFEEK